jgi:hypothetical protein
MSFHASGLELAQEAHQNGDIGVVAGLNLGVADFELAFWVSSKERGLSEVVWTIARMGRHGGVSSNDLIQW